MAEVCRPIVGQKDGFYHSHSPWRAANTSLQKQDTMTERTTITITGLGVLTHEKSLFYYDGDLVTLFRDAHGTATILYWADQDQEARCISWMVFQVSEDTLRGYCEARITTRDIILFHRLGPLLLAKDSNWSCTGTKEWTSEDVSLSPPECYLPEHGHYLSLEHDNRCEDENR